MGLLLNYSQAIHAEMLIETAFSVLSFRSSSIWQCPVHHPRSGGRGTEWLETQSSAAIVLYRTYRDCSGGERRARGGGATWINENLRDS